MALDRKPDASSSQYAKLSDYLGSVTTRYQKTELAGTAWVWPPCFVYPQKAGRNKVLENMGVKSLLFCHALGGAGALDKPGP